MEIQEKGTLNFTVDSELLRELGERLIGAPYIALAELVKNSYDADATHVLVDLDLGKKCIVVEDNGNGMGYKEFDDFWMRVGSRQKERARVSERLGRLMTGSKGVGRLSVQYLAGELSLSTVSYKDKTRRLNAHVNWDEAVRAGNLTEAKVDYYLEKSEGLKEGTRIVLTKLKQDWKEKEVEGLAEQIWWLTPPFRGRLESPEDLKLKFDIDFRSQDSQYIGIFENKMRAVLDLWEARLVGSNQKGHVKLAVEFKGEQRPVVQEYRIENCDLEDGNFEIRAYRLRGRQPGGIPIDEAREYFRKFGGVHVYDGGFHLPFYGDPKNDWLGIELDHARRLSLSRLLPRELQVSEGMTYLPTLSRLYGVVNVDTSREPYLKLLVTRDRLQESPAQSQLVDFVRWALDFYAREVALRESGSKEKEVEAQKPRVETLQEAIDTYKEQLPAKVYKDLSKTINRVVQEIDSSVEKEAKKASSLGPLATAGISTLAAQHEIKRQFSTFQDFLAQLDKIKTADSKSERLLADVKQELTGLYQRLRATYALFNYFADRDLRERERMPAKKTIETIVDQLKTLMRDIPIWTQGIDKDLLLPKATFAEWSSIFQNVILNAYNAMLDSKKKFIDVSSREQGQIREILVKDTGIGVDVKDAEKLFEPFVRKVKISPEMQALGYGGTGLGLTIVRLVASNIRCEVSFVPPERGFSTAFSIRWRETR